MHNKILIPIIEILSLATIGGLAYVQQNKSANKLAINTSSQLQSLPSSSFPIIVSSSSQMPSSSIAAVSSNAKVEEVKVESSKPVIKSTPTCNLPESESLIKTDDGCFAFSIGGRLIGSNPISEAELNTLNIYFKQAAINYYSKVNSKFLSSQHFISADYTKKIDNANFEVYIGMIDADYYKKKYGNIPGDYGEINSAKYLISKNITTNKWTYQFINFETSN